MNFLCGRFVCCFEYSIIVYQVRCRYKAQDGVREEYAPCSRSTVMPSKRQLLECFPKSIRRIIVVFVFRNVDTFTSKDIISRAISVANGVPAINISSNAARVLQNSAKLVNLQVDILTYCSPISISKR